MRKKRVVVITGAAPYLGGPSTWLPLRRAAPELELVEIDTLDFADAPEVTEACRQAVLVAARDADCVVAHYIAARPVIEALAAIPDAAPALLLSPLLVRRSNPALAALRAIMRTRVVGGALSSIGRSKRRRLLVDRWFLKKQMSRLVAEAHISDAMLEEASERVADPRSARAVERTAEIFLEITNPIDPAVDAKVQHQRALLGTSRLDRKMAKRLPATVLNDVRGAAMIEAPEVVAQTLREML